jgi:hypothetical protein
MFLDSLIESQPRRAARRRWTTLVSFALQAAAVAILVLAPLFYTGALPPLRFGSTIRAPLAAPPRDNVTKLVTTDLPVSEARNDVFTAPSSIPVHVDMHPDPAPSGREQPSNPDWNALCATTLCVEGGTPFSDEARDRTIATILKPPTVMPRWRRRRRRSCLRQGCWRAC